MTENIFNIYYIDSGTFPGIMMQYSVACHQVEGDDNYKLGFLQHNSEQDFVNAKVFLVPKSCELRLMDERGNQKDTLKGAIKISTVQQIVQQGNYSLFEEAFQFFNAPNSPLCVGSVVVNDKLLHLMSIEEQEKYKAAQFQGHF